MEEFKVAEFTMNAVRNYDLNTILINVDGVMVEKLYLCEEIFYYIVPFQKY